MSRSFYIEDNEAMPAVKYEETQPTGYTLIADNTMLKDCYIKLYRKRAGDGVAWFEEFRADLMMKILDSTYTPAEVFLLEQHLEHLTANVIGGNWLTAQYFAAALPLSGIFDQTMKDEIEAVIAAYIAENY